MNGRCALQVVSWFALAATLVPSLLFLAGRIELDLVKWLMLLATLVWFGVTPLWMRREQAGA